MHHRSLFGTSPSINLKCETFLVRLFLKKTSLVFIPRLSNLVLTADVRPLGTCDVWVETPLEALLLKAGAHYECHPKPSIKFDTAWAEVSEPVVTCQVLLQLAGLLLALLF